MRCRLLCLLMLILMHLHQQQRAAAAAYVVLRRCGLCVSLSSPFALGLRGPQMSPCGLLLLLLLLLWSSLAAVAAADATAVLVEVEGRHPQEAPMHRAVEGLRCCCCC